MNIAGLVKTSLVEYPGRVAACVFTQGCDLDCFYCHNRGLIPVSAGTVPEQQVTDFLVKRKGLLDGVVITGGEPSVQPDLAGFLLKLKQLGYRVKLDTNGQHPDVMQQLADRQLVDYAAVDYKAPAVRYKEICGESADAQKVIQTIRILAAEKIDYQVRTTLVPQLKKEDLLIMAQELPELPLWVLNAYRIPEIFRQRDAQKVYEDRQSPGLVQTIAHELTLYQNNVTLTDA